MIGGKLGTFELTRHHAKNNPCAISFMQYTPTWSSQGQDYRRLKMAVHEVFDIENSRRASKKTEFQLPAIEHIIYVDADMTINGPISKHIDFISATYTGQDYTLFEQPIKGKHKDGWYHGGLWHTHMHFGRNFSRFWLRQFDIRNVLSKERYKMDQWPLNEVIDIYSDGHNFPLRNNIDSDLALDVNVLSFSSPQNTYPLVPGANSKEDEQSVFLHWSGIELPEYRGHLMPAYERIRKKLGAPAFMPKKEIGRKSFHGWKKEKLNFKIEPTTLLSMENVKSNLVDKKTKNIIVVLERPKEEKLPELIYAILRYLQPQYIVVLVDKKKECWAVTDAAYRADERLCELDSDHTPLEPSRSNGHGGRNDASTGSRAVLCEVGWTEKSCTFDILKQVSRSNGQDELSNYVLFWNSNVAPLGDIQDKFFKDGKPSFFTVGNPSNGNKCKAHAPWLLVEAGSPFTVPCSAGNWRSTFEASNGCKNSEKINVESSNRGEGHYWKNI
jgi:hypothetical protein